MRTTKITDSTNNLNVYNWFESAMRDIYVASEKLKAIHKSESRGAKNNLKLFIIDPLDKVLHRFRASIPAQYDAMIMESTKNDELALQHEAISEAFSKMSQENRNLLEKYAEELLENQQNEVSSLPDA